MGVPCFRFYEAIDIEPLIALVHANERTMPSTCPDASDDRFQADAMLIHRPQLYLGVRMGLLDVANLLWQLALESLLLCGIGLVVTRTRNLEREAEPLEILPAALGMDLAPRLLAHPASDFGTAPQAAISRSLRKHLL